MRANRITRLVLLILLKSVFYDINFRHNSCVTVYMEKESNPMYRDEAVKLM